MNQEFFCRKQFEIGHIFPGVLFVEEICQCPGFGIRGNGFFGILKPVVVADERFDLIAGPRGQITVKIIETRIVDVADAAPTFRAAEVGCFKIFRNPFAEPARTIAQTCVKTAIECDLMCRFVYDR